MAVSDSRGGERSASRSRVCRQTQWELRGDSPRHTFQREYGETGGRWAEKKKGEEATHRTICRVTRRNYTAEKWVRIVPEGLRGEAGVAALCRREGIPSNLHCRPAGSAWRCSKPTALSGSGALDRTHAASVGRHSAPPGAGGVSGPLLGITAARCSGFRTDVDSGTETGGCSILKSMYAYLLRERECTRFGSVRAGR